MYFRTVGDVKVEHRFTPKPQVGDTYFDEDTGAFYIFYGEGNGWLQVSREDLMIEDRC